MDMETRDLADGVGLLALGGRLNMVSAPGVKAAIDELIGGGRPRVVVDLSSVSFMDSSGLGALVAGLKRARQAQGDLRISGANEQVLTVLRLTNLDRVLRPRDTVEEAGRDW
ncbi:MAG TPA: STAS domain-containing protein [Propionibacteriaceae bacterium]|nr:STAS domain-containing protein [Propionibacteriaceae bacterium]